MNKHDLVLGLSQERLKIKNRKCAFFPFQGNLVNQDKSTSDTIKVEYEGNTPVISSDQLDLTSFTLYSLINTADFFSEDFSLFCQFKLFEDNINSGDAWRRIVWWSQDSCQIGIEVTQKDSNTSVSEGKIEFLGWQDSSTAKQSFISKNQQNDSSWHNLTIKKEKNFFTVKIDNEILCDNQDLSKLNFSSTENLHISGYKNNSYEYCANGYIKNLKLYNYITSDEKS